MLTNNQVITIVNELTSMHQIAFYILCTLDARLDGALLAHGYPSWAYGWLSGECRSAELADRVYADIYYPENLYSSICWSVARAVLGIAERVALRPEGGVSGWLSSTGRIAANFPLGVLQNVLLKHFVCPHCYKQPDQHTKEGKCLFGAHTWEGINNVWKP